MSFELKVGYSPDLPEFQTENLHILMPVSVGPDFLSETNPVDEPHFA